MNEAIKLMQKPTQEVLDLSDHVVELSLSGGSESTSFLSQKDGSLLKITSLDGSPAEMIALPSDDPEALRWVNQEEDSNGN